MPRVDGIEGHRRAINRRRSPVVPRCRGDMSPCCVSSMSGEPASSRWWPRAKLS